MTGPTGIAATVWSRIVNLPWYSKQPPIEAPNYETIVENILTNTKFLQSLKEVSNGNAKFDDTNLIKELKLIEESYNEKANLQLEVFRSELQEIKDKLNVLTSNEATAKDKTEADMLALKARLDNLASTINIRADTLETKSNEDKQEFDTIKVKLTGIEDQLITLETQLTELHASVQNCCQNRTEIEDMINKVINETFNDTNTNPMLDLLAKYFVTKPELQQVFHNVEEAKLKINEDVKSMLESNANIYNREKIVEELLVQLQQKSAESSQGTTEKPAMNVLNELEVKSIVEQALLQYDADKTGLFDYALETAGGSVVSTRCTETYVQKSGMYSIFGIPIWYPSNNPRTVIQPGVLPGECWAFKGSAGFIVIQLSEPITPFQFSLEHISKSMSPSGRIDSAPREFSVYGLQTQKDTEPVKLGDYVYLEDGNPLQFFQVKHHLLD